MNIKQTIILDDYVIDILHNELLSSKPYLLRLTTWSDRHEIRVDENDLKDIISGIQKVLRLSALERLSQLDQELGLQ